MKDRGRTGRELRVHGVEDRGRERERELRRAWRMRIEGGRERVDGAW